MFCAFHGIMIGETLGRYRIIDTIGAGGMGVVYRAYDPTLEREVALKLLNGEALDSTSAHDRFVREARALSHLNHPHICTIYEIGEADGRTFIAMEYVRGRPLSALIPSDGLATESMVRYGAQIADAIGHAHGHGIVHRDLKSANVVVTPEGAIKVLDFGLAKHVDRGPHSAMRAQEASKDSTPTAEVTQPGVVMGTPGYMAPEVLIGQPADARADIWALGVILHEMATGTLPFTGPTPLEVASAILKESPTPLPARVSPMLRRIVLRCLAKEPGQRYQTAGEVVAALEAASSASMSEVRSARPMVRRVAFAVAGVLAAAAIAAVASNWSGWRSTTTAPIRSIAVLPLENLSGDPEQEYFADGMTEQLTVDLSSLAMLRVISRNSPSILALAAHVHAVAGQKREAQQLIHEIEKAAEQRYFCPYEIGAAHVSLGDHDTALKWFRKGLDDRADCMAWLGVEPWIESFRSDPRYAELLRDVGLAPESKAPPR